MKLFVLLEEIKGARIALANVCVVHEDTLVVVVEPVHHLGAVLLKIAQLHALLQLEFLLLPQIQDLLRGDAQLLHGLFNPIRLVEVVAVKLFRLAAGVARVAGAARRQQ